MTDTAPEFTVVVTCYYEEKSIEEFHERLTRSMSLLGRPFEIILVNDGSTDGTWEKLQAIFRKDPRVSLVIDFFRNFGQAAAMTAATCESRGRYLIYIDSDLQVDPEEIPLLIRELDQGYHVVCGLRKNRQDSFSRKMASQVANRIMRKASRSRLSDFGCTFKLLDARLVRAFNLGPHKLFNPVEIIAKSGKVTEIPITHHPRKYGKSGWTVMKLFEYYMEHVVNASNRPFQYLMLGNLLIATAVIVRVASGFWVDWRILNTVSNGLVLNLVVITFFINLGVLCGLGELTIRSLRILQRAPQYIIREIVRR